MKLSYINTANYNYYCSTGCSFIAVVEGNSFIENIQGPGSAIVPTLVLTVYIAQYYM